MDIASLTGIVCGLGLILSAILMGGDFSLFVNIPGIMIVVGGTLSATLLTFPLADRSEEHTSELQSRRNLVCRLLLEKKKQTTKLQMSS